MITHFLKFFSLFFFLEKLCCWVFPSLTFIREESRYLCKCAFCNSNLASWEPSMQWALASSTLAARDPRKKKWCSESRQDRTYSQSYSRHLKACSCSPVEAQCVVAGLCPCAASVTAANVHGAQLCEASVYMCHSVYGQHFSNKTE